ncbi:MAG: RraA family protein [Alicyclobacillus sp.]|nr:RraA family protein [Alicyclobacillus sp.]
MSGTGQFPFPFFHQNDGGERVAAASTAEWRDRLLRLDTCALSDALDALQLRGVARGLQAVTVQQKLAGRVLTVGLRPYNGQPSPYHLGTRAIAAGSAEHVIVMANQGTAEGAGWGGLLSLAAKLRGIQGVVVDGACRDVDEIRELGFPVYARTVTPLTARGRRVEKAFNVPVEVDGVWVEPGDWVLADGSGVVFVPANQLAAVVQEAERIAAKEAEMAAALRAGEQAHQVMGRSYETLLQDSHEQTGKDDQA